MAQQHHPHDISASSFEQVINILRQVLLDANFEGGDIAQIIHRLDQQRHRIVRDVQPLNDIYHPEHVDALTGLGNQGALIAALSEECLHYQKEQRPLSLAIIRPAPYGREALPTDHAGIQLLDRYLTGALSRTARRADTLCRRSDGLFALVLRATDAGKAMQAARRIHAAVTRELFATATGKQRIDLAIGLASCSDAVSSEELLLLAAERAIGSAGQAGQMIVVA